MGVQFSACFILLVATQSFGQQWGSITLPAQGMFDLEEGTVEAWVLFEFDPLSPTDSMWDPRGGWFYFEIPEGPTDRGAVFSISAGHKDLTSNSRADYATHMRVGWSIEGVEAPHPLLLSCAAFGQNQWHHFAVTWRDGRHVAVFADGEPMGQMHFPWPVIRDIPSTARLHIACPGYTLRNWLAIDELRVSSVARRPEDLGFHQAPLQPDPHTLLLEGFEEIAIREGATITMPVVVAGAEIPRSYPIIGGRLIQGKVGAGFAFNPEAPADEDPRREGP